MKYLMLPRVGWLGHSMMMLVFCSYSHSLLKKGSLMRRCWFLLARKAGTTYVFVAKPFFAALLLLIIIRSNSCLLLELMIYRAIWFCEIFGVRASMVTGKFLIDESLIPFGNQDSLYFYMKNVLYVYFVWKYFKMLYSMARLPSFVHTASGHFEASWSGRNVHGSGIALQ